MTKRVYLSGPLSGQTIGSVDAWHSWVASHLADGIKPLGPLRGEPLLETMAPDTVLDTHFEQSILSSAKAITWKDRLDVQQCDMVLVNLIGANQVSRGTMIEIGWADGFRKPVVIAMDDGNVHDHPMVREIGLIVPTLADAVSVVNTTLSVGV